MTTYGTDVVAQVRNERAHSSKSLILTDLSPRAVCQIATDPSAVLALHSFLAGSTVVHLPRLHAKVYIADGKRAIHTSGNLTRGGLEQNIEYSISISDVRLVERIEQDIRSYAHLGAVIDTDTLRLYCGLAEEILENVQFERAAISKVAHRKLSNVLQRAEQSLIQARLKDGPLHTVFARTIEYVLARFGPMTTAQLHHHIHTLHPDLCDDSVDRVIDGKRYGKRWKHAVRTAQQQLKKKGKVSLAGTLWHLEK